MKRALSLALVLVALAACERVTEPVSSPLAVPPPLFQPSGGACGAERQITTDPSDQRSPAISGDRIVWEDHRNGNSDIYLFDLAEETEQRITTDANEQRRPAMSGDRIVWQDGRNGNLDIYLFDLASRTEQRITTDPDAQFDPAISGDRVVWDDYRNYTPGGNDNRDIYLFDLATAAEHPVTTDPNFQAVPSISGNWIVWTDYRDEHYHVYRYDLATETAQPISATPEDQWSPAISGDRIVWQDYRSGNYDLYLFDLATGNEQQISADPVNQWFPGISGDRIVWTEIYWSVADGAMLAHIYLLDLATGTKQRITTADAKVTWEDQQRIAISGDRIVWTDHRNGNADIYLFDLSAPDATPPTITPPPDVSTGNDPGLASAAVNPGSATATDGCSNVVVLGARSDGLALGDPYPVGVTTITWTATDEAGNPASAEQHITVVDVEAPVLSVPEDFETDATSPSGAEVVYTATATDNVGVATFACTPASGTLLAIDTHTVSCSASDAAGNTATAAFLVTVKGAEEQVTDLQDTVAGLDLPEGTEASLGQQLDNAQAAIAAGQPGTACNQLRAFINHVTAQIGKKLTAEEGAILIAEAERIRAALGC